MSTGTVEFKFKGKTYHTWYKVFGDLKGGKTPLVAVHGGPGMSHHYILPHKIIFEKAGIPVVVYDQLGNSYSSHALDEPKEFWTPEVFIEELDNLLTKLDIHSKFDLLGHSWGGMLSASYASRLPRGLNRLIISNSTTDAPSLEKLTNELLEQSFPPEFVKRMRELERTGQAQSEDYKAGMMQFFGKHMCTVMPPPQDLLDTLAAVEKNENVSMTMMGISVLRPTGYLKTSGWSVINGLQKINVPMLLIGTLTEEKNALPYFLTTPKVKWVEINDATHMPMFENPDRYFSVIIRFLESVPV